MCLKTWERAPIQSNCGPGILQQLGDDKITTAMMYVKVGKCQKTTPKKPATNTWKTKRRMEKTNMNWWFSSLPEGKWLSEKCLEDDVFGLFRAPEQVCNRPAVIVFLGYSLPPVFDCSILQKDVYVDTNDFTKLQSACLP